MMDRGQSHNQIDRQAAPPAGCVVARGGLASPAGNGPRAPSRHTTSFTVASSPHATVTTGRACAHLARPVTPKLHVDDFLRHDATCMGAGGQLVGLPLIFMGLDHVAQDSSPITHFTNAHWTRPACRDGGNMRHCAAPHTQIGEA